MKIRSGFVSNSSSSSFIVISDQGNNYNIPISEEGVLDVGDMGCCEFGWAHELYPTFWDRLNFTYLQTDCGADKAQLAMLEEVLRERIKGLKTIEWNITSDYPAKDGKLHGYIDHQSARCEGQNMEMFKSKETLTNFLFGVHSYIQGGNDNDY